MESKGFGYTNDVRQIFIEHFNCTKDVYTDTLTYIHIYIDMYVYMVCMYV